MHEHRDILRLNRDNPGYLEQAAAEAEHWGRKNSIGNEAFELNSNPVIDCYTNERFTGNRELTWYASISAYGTFRRALLVGASGLTQELAILRTNPSLHVTLMDISEQALTRDRNRLKDFPARVAIQRADLNFVELPAEAYDVIISSNTLHHIVNLEHAAYQINRALTTDGYFFVNDYVGERRSQFTPMKMRVFEWLCERESVRRGQPRGIEWIDNTADLSPFCQIRSDEILGVLREYLLEFEVHTTGALFAPLLLTRPALDAQPAVPAHRFVGKIMAKLRSRLLGHSGLSKEFLRELLLTDALMCDADILAPGNAFAIYRKRV